MADDALIDQVRTKKVRSLFAQGRKETGAGAYGRQQFEAYVDGSIHIHSLTLFSFYEQILGSGMCICQFSACRELDPAFGLHAALQKYAWFSSPVK
jgi:hypothetical protein